jgi:hypothetical protein
MKLRPRKREMYRLPWSVNDNPIGWVEITDRCNIYCKGCYRQQLVGHSSLEQIKEDILFLKEWRNCDNISIAGGEPLIHPQIIEIVAFIHEQGLKPLILTNGVRLNNNKPFLEELKQAGLMGLTFHIDSAQRRPGWFGKSELELCELRQQYAEMVAEVGGLFVSFGCTIYYSNLNEIPKIVRWANDNADIVNGLVFITYRGAPETDQIEFTVGDQRVDAQEQLSYGHAEAEEIDITSRDVYRVIQESYPHYDTATYLGGTQRHDAIKWLISLQVGTKGKMYGSVGPKAAELAESLYHLIRGRYLAYSPSKRLPKIAFLASLFDKGLRKTQAAFWRDVLRNPARLFAPLYIQSIGIVQAPDILPDGRTCMCDSCPDMAVWDGQLVHSCRLDEWRIYGQYVTPQMRREIEEGGGQVLTERSEEAIDYDERLTMPVIGD